MIADIARSLRRIRASSTQDPGPSRTARPSRNANGATVSFVCPACTRRCKDPDLARAGYCAHCRDHTGLCQSGRTIRADVGGRIVPDPSWHVPCTAPGTVLWQVEKSGQPPAKVLVCAEHDKAMEAGEVRWLTATRLSPRP